MKPIAMTGNFSKPSYSLRNQLKIQTSSQRSLSTSKKSADSSQYGFCRNDESAQSDNRPLTAGDLYILENGWNARLTDPHSVVRRGKLVSLSTRSERNPIALVITVISKPDKIGVSIHLLPTGEDLTLPPQLSISLLSSTDSVLQAATTKAQDNSIQLKPFEGNPGVCFTVEVSLDGVKVSEAFQL